MLLDPRVEKRKFEAEVATIRENATRLAKLGVLLVRAERQEIDLVFIPHKHAEIRIAVPTVLAAAGSEPPSAQLQVLPGVSCPLTALPFGVRLDLDGYDQRPASVSFRSPRTWEPLPLVALPHGNITENGKTQTVILAPHPKTKLPFLCLRGVREYHEHPQHDGDQWAMYRGSINAYALIERIAHVMLESTAPQALLVLQLNWAPQPVQ